MYHDRGRSTYIGWVCQRRGRFDERPRATAANQTAWKIWWSTRARARRCGLIERGSKSATMHPSVCIAPSRVCVTYGRNKSGSGGGDAPDALCLRWRERQCSLEQNATTSELHVGQKVTKCTSLENASSRNSLSVHSIILNATPIADLGQTRKHTASVPVFLQREKRFFSHILVFFF